MAQGVHPVDPDKFSEACAKYLNRECNMIDASKIAGMSPPTFSKYLKILLLGDKFPDNLFGGKRNEMAD
jgi:hypothetical protein